MKTEVKRNSFEPQDLSAAEIERQPLKKSKSEIKTGVEILGFLNTAHDTCTSCSSLVKSLCLVSAMLF